MTTKGINKILVHNWCQKDVVYDKYNAIYLTVLLSVVMSATDVWFQAARLTYILIFVFIGMLMLNYWCFSPTFSMSFWAVIAYTNYEGTRESGVVGLYQLF